MVAAVFSLPALVLGPWKRHSVSVHRGEMFAGVLHSTRLTSLLLFLIRREGEAPSHAINCDSTDMRDGWDCGERRTSKELAGGAGDSDDMLRLLVVPWLLFNSKTSHHDDDDMRLSST
ncbi:hypothetical protein CCHR01_05490 [Colletotrichum chrysophilum]|uniref:Uncharacterized protein n=1 Tax=Colletotrichum chrysophilum TaxID=1836956 RepID=A0AAD9EKJ1_9PEZI|nr:hypothetical protein CCHR01_05490 [Colletotrichum chrysophilum]